MSIALDCAILSVDLSSDVRTVESPPLNGKKLAACGVTLLSSHLAYDRYSLSSVTSAV